MEGNSKSAPSISDLDFIRYICGIKLSSNSLAVTQQYLGAFKSHTQYIDPVCTKLVHVLFCVSTCVHGRSIFMTLGPFCFLVHVLFTRMCTGGDDPAEGGEYCAFCVFEYLCSWTDHMHDLGPFLFSCACPVHADVHGW